MAAYMDCSVRGWVGGELPADLLGMVASVVFLCDVLYIPIANLHQSSLLEDIHSLSGKPPPQGTWPSEW